MLFEDGYSRAVHYPKTHANDVFVAGNLLRFDEIEGEGLHSVSVASNAIAGSEQGVHDYGCRAAAQKNAGFEQRKGRPPHPWPAKPLERVYYIGSYEFDAAAALGIICDFHVISIVPVEEHGNPEHCEMRLTHRQDIEGDERKRKADRMKIKDDLFDLLHGPLRYVSPEDHLIREDLMAVELPTLPA